MYITNRFIIITLYASCIVVVVIVIFLFITPKGVGCFLYSISIEDGPKSAPEVQHCVRMDHFVQPERASKQCSQNPE